MSFIVNKTMRSLIIVTMLSSTAHPISEKAATASSISAGVAAGLGVGALTYYGLFITPQQSWGLKCL